MFVKHKGGNINCNVILLSYYQRKLSIDIKSGLCTLSFHLSSLLLCCGGWALEQRSKSGTREGEPGGRRGQGLLMRPVLRYLLHRQHNIQQTKENVIILVYFIFWNILSKNDKFWRRISWSILLQFYNCLFERLPVNELQWCKFLPVKSSSGWENGSKPHDQRNKNQHLILQLQIMMTSSSVLKTQRMTWDNMLSVSGTYPLLSWSSLRSSGISLSSTL